MSLKEFLKSKRIQNAKDQVEPTHLSFVGGKYDVAGSEEEFLQLYLSALQSKKERKDLFLIEKTSKKFAFFLDIDFNESVSYEESKRNVQKLVQECIGFFSENIEEGSMDVGRNIKYVVSCRNNKFHVNFPKIIVGSETAKKIACVLTERSGVQIDASVYRTGLRMLGSRKGKDKVEGEEIYNIMDLQTDEKKDFSDLTVDDLKECCIRRGESDTLTKFKHIEVHEEEERSSNTEVHTITKNVGEGMLEHVQKYINECSELFVDDKLIDAKKITELHKVVYAQNKFGKMNYYVTTGQTVCPFKNREHKRKSNPVFIEISHKGLCFRCLDEDCLKQSYPEKEVPLSSNEDLQEFNETVTVRYNKSELQITDKMRELLNKGLTATHYNIAKAMFEIYKDRYRVDNVRNTDWYEFDGVRWKRSNKMHINVSEELPKYFDAMRIASSGGDLGDVELEDYDAVERESSYNAQIRAIGKKLESVAFKTNVINEAKYLFSEHDPDFVKKLDSDPNLIGFDNGVYDLSAHEFRKSVVDDYVSFSTGYDYVAYDPENQNVKDIYSFLSKIITNKEIMDYTLKTLGRGVLGLPDEKFYIWTGLSGANGKSTLVNFLESALGDYACSQDVALLTNKRPVSNSATPEVVEMRGKRMIFFQEPESTDKLRTGILKQFTGGDTIKARELFKSPISFKSQASFIMCCNDLPPVTSVDGGTWRRIRVIEFKSRFCENPVKPNEFLIDPQLKEKLKVWKPYFMSILLHYFKKYKEEGLVEPSEVTSATSKYKTDNDKYNDFFEECILESVDNSQELFSSTNSIYEEFVEWWRGNYGFEKCPTKNELRKALKVTYGEEQTQVVPSGQHKKKMKGFPIKVTNASSEVIDFD